MTDSKADLCLLSLLNSSCEHLTMAIYVIYNTFRDMNFLMALIINGPM